MRSKEYSGRLKNRAPAILAFILALVCAIEKDVKAKIRSLFFITKERH